jgi:hypothetical protein
MVRGKTVSLGMLVDVRAPDRFSLPDDVAEEAAAAGEIADPAAGFLVQS